MNQTEITMLLSKFSCMSYNKIKGKTLVTIGRMSNDAINRINDEGLT